ncbi:MAG: hypothetical protein JSV04_06380 [Candidatus Heimdallarchaeota archaeon]|nr:MAG: hypothetical protein JSV04_06380 [Candidatus Heimdallarchaeota archaeon]
MNPDEPFTLDGLDELDTQVKLYQMGVETFSPYASTGKVDMIIRSENGENVRYADIKVCTGVRRDDDVVWELEVGFFMNNESFLILAVRLPDKDEMYQKHHIVMDSKIFLQIAKKHRLKVQKDKWVLKVPFKDLQIINTRSTAKFSRAITRSVKEYFDNWESLLEWQNPPE